MRIVRRYAMVLSGFVALIGLASCAQMKQKPEEQPIKIVGDIRAASNLNPDRTGRPSPVVIRVFQLRSLQQFRNAQFDDIYYRATTTLQPDLVDSAQEMVIRPSERRPYRWDVNKDTRFIGVIAAFHRLSNADWRTFIELPPDQTDVPLRITLDGLAVSTAIAR